MKTLNYRIAEYIKKSLIKEGVRTVIWGDGILVEAAGEMGSRVNHPLNKMQVSLNALEKSDWFIKGYYNGNDKNGNPKRVRGFRLKDNV